MKKKKRFVLLGLILLIIASVILISRQFVINTAYADLNNDGKREFIVLTRKWGQQYGSSLVIVALQRLTGERIQIYEMESIKPWKVQTPDVDGDGILELSLSVYKKTRLNPVMAKRPFLYSWKGMGIVPKWFGSRLARSFTDYVFCDMNGDRKDELISIELLENDEKLINVYEWKDFGFEGLAESAPFNDVLTIKKTADGRVKAKIKTNNKWEWVYIALDDNHVVIE